MTVLTVALIVANKYEARRQCQNKAAVIAIEKKMIKPTMSSVMAHPISLFNEG